MGPAQARSAVLAQADRRRAAPQTPPLLPPRPPRQDGAAHARPARGRRKSRDPGSGGAGAGAARRRPSLGGSGAARCGRTRCRSPTREHGGAGAHGRAAGADRGGERGGRALGELQAAGAEEHPGDPGAGQGRREPAQVQGSAAGPRGRVRRPQRPQRRGDPPDPGVRHRPRAAGAGPHRRPGELQEAVFRAEGGRGVPDQDLLPGEPRDRVGHEVHPAHVPEGRQDRQDRLHGGQLRAPCRGLRVPHAHGGGTQGHAGAGQLQHQVPLHRRRQDGSPVLGVEPHHQEGVEGLRGRARARTPAPAPARRPPAALVVLCLLLLPPVLWGAPAPPPPPRVSLQALTGTARLMSRPCARGRCWVSRALGPPRPGCPLPEGK